ncbi:MAG: hypothetical protein H0W20_09060 [Chthoniobacterales bacterium]|nr:hypothetical protein [Chthoniobacterales bacterium]
MRPQPFAEAEFTPVFDWSPRRGRKLSLISFITASAVVHALCFYVFQVIYPPTVALLPPPARVTVISPNTDEGRLLLRWIEAEDPALSSTTQRPPEAPAPAPPRPAHVPSYAGRVPPLKELPPLEPDLSVPSAQPPGPVPISRAAPTATGGVVPTTLTFADAAGRVGAPHIPPLQFTTSSKEPPQAAQFRVGIGERGHVQHCFIESSSGDPALDAQARSHIVRARFPAISSQQSAVSNTLLWTTATIEWGNDIVRAAKASAESPAP